MSEAASQDGKSALYTLPEPLPMLNAVRGTILVLDWRAFREAGFYADYEAALPELQREIILAVTAGSWVPVATALTHYGALDRLHLEEQRIRRVGYSVGDGAHGAFLSTLVRLAGKMGVSPWRALEQSYKLWTRSWRGGGIAVYRLSEHMAEVAVLETPVCRSRFFRCSFGGALCAGIAPFAGAVTCSEMSSVRTELSVSYRLSWQD